MISYILFMHNILRSFQKPNKTHGLEAQAKLGFQTTLFKNYSSLKLSDLVDDLETTDRETVRAIAIDRRKDVATAVEAQAVRAVIVWRSRPTAAAVAETVETAIVAVAITRSRVPDGRCAAELAGEVHAFVGAVIE